VSTIGRYACAGATTVVISDAAAPPRTAFRDTAATVVGVVVLSPHADDSAHSAAATHVVFILLVNAIDNAETENPKFNVPKTAEATPPQDCFMVVVGAHRRAVAALPQQVADVEGTAELLAKINEAVCLVNDRRHPRWRAR